MRSTGTNLSRLYTAAACREVPVRGHLVVQPATTAHAKAMQAQGMAVGAFSSLAVRGLLRCGMVLDGRAALCCKGTLARTAARDSRMHKHVVRKRRAMRPWCEPGSAQRQPSPAGPPFSDHEGGLACRKGAVLVRPHLTAYLGLLRTAHPTVQDMQTGALAIPEEVDIPRARTHGPGACQQCKRKSKAPTDGAIIQGCWVAWERCVIGGLA